MCFPSILSHLHFTKHHWCVCLLVKEKGILSSCLSHPCAGPGGQGKGQKLAVGGAQGCGLRVPAQAPTRWKTEASSQREDEGFSLPQPFPGRAGANLTVLVACWHWGRAWRAQGLWRSPKCVQLPRTQNSACFCRRFSFRSETKGLYL